ncbi:hypothetical protein D3C71_1567590 [compost metagenome]
MGQARDTLVAEHGKSGGRDRRAGVHGNADQHIAAGLRIEADVHHLADRNALVAHGSLGLQAADAVLGGQLVLGVLVVVAGEPQRQSGKQGRHQHHEQPRRHRMRLVFHQVSPAATGPLLRGAMARSPRSPRKKVSIKGWS